MIQRTQILCQWNLVFFIIALCLIIILDLYLKIFVKIIRILNKNSTLILPIQKNKQICFVSKTRLYLSASLSAWEDRLRSLEKLTRISNEVNQSEIDKFIWSKNLNCYISKSLVEIKLTLIFSFLLIHKKMENQNDYNKELESQKKIAYTAGLLQADITIKTLLKSLAEGVVFINESGKIILINDKLAELTGYDKHQVMGESLNIFIPEKLHKKHLSHISKYFSEPKVRPMGIGMELIARRKDHSTFPIEISISYLDTDSGRIGIGFLTDITSRKEIENELKRRNDELDAYAHTVAHDLSSSLTGIVGYSELLIDPQNEFSKEEIDSFLQRIAKDGRKMTSIIKELLLFASMKKEEVDVSEVKMKEVIESACQRLKYQIEEESAQIEISEPILNCKGYALWIEEVWLNYISNAIKYGGTSPKIKIYSSKSENGFIKYSVKDEGEGISDELKTIIFNEKDRNKDKLTKGFGLGLSIVKRILEKLDGYATVESETGEGSTFSFYLKE